jgi:hypothetical protein
MREADGDLGQPVLLVVAAYPEPKAAVREIDGKNPVMQANARRPVPTDLFEVKGWMTRV